MDIEFKNWLGLLSIIINWHEKIISRFAILSNEIDRFIYEIDRLIILKKIVWVETSIVIFILINFKILRNRNNYLSKQRIIY